MLSRRSLRDTLQVLIVALLLYLAVSVAVQSVHVIGISMYPTLHNDDVLVASKVDYRLHGPQRGDIVILRDPLHPDRNLIKRVIGIPGDHILIHAHHVYVGGERLQEPYLHTRWMLTGDWPLPENGVQQPAVVPPQDYFVLGDNRDDSSDSREFGFVPRDEIAGRALVRVWPLNDIGVLSSRPQLASS